VWKADAPSSGAYRITVHKPDREIRLEPNPKKAKLTIVFKVVPEESTALNLFETKQLDVLQAIPATEQKELEKKGLLLKSPGAATFFLSFHTQKAPFDDPRWRKAISAAIDRESLAKLLPGSFQASSSYLPQAIAGSFPYKKPSFEREFAWAKQQKKPELQLVFASSALANLLMQRVQENLRVNLDLNVKLEPMEWKAYLGRIKADAPAFFYMGYSAPYDDPTSHLKVFHSEEPENRSKYKSAEYDKLLAQLKSEHRGPQRKKIASQAQRLLVERDAVLVPLVEREQLHAVQKELKGFRVNPYGVMDLRELRR
jgi:ABC-type oligopeptide transport system substrate-binding subunit